MEVYESVEHSVSVSYVPTDVAQRLVVEKAYQEVIEAKRRRKE